MLERLPDTLRWETDAYAGYKRLPRNRHFVGKGGAANWRWWLHSVLRSKLNRLVRKTKGYSKSVEMLERSLSLAFDRLENPIPAH